MSPYKSTYLCLMCLFIVVLLVGILVLLITHFKEHRRFLNRMDYSMEVIKDAESSIDTTASYIWGAVSKMQDDVHAMRERIVPKQAKQIETVDLPVWVAEPCPVCGYKPSIYEYTDGRNTMVLCQHCNKFSYTAGGETVRSAVYAWNKTVAEYLAKVKAQAETLAEKTCNDDYCDI